MKLYRFLNYRNFHKTIVFSEPCIMRTFLFRCVKMKLQKKKLFTMKTFWTRSELQCINYCTQKYCNKDVNLFMTYWHSSIFPFERLMRAVQENIITNIISCLQTYQSSYYTDICDNRGPFMYNLCDNYFFSYTFTNAIQFSTTNRLNNKKKSCVVVRVE